ncbi:hypothetical protein [Niabella hibiscisoli]|uniref:hypothetical protein n=1 Tax=Niabella hibiscisoli TaxID=1825928 RepID=UPI001F0F5204|nr:hypothetical protein [Niabella hibiscisoli]MCH5719828.1 hypothetical protein [Niabella hibiscisoli]
MTNYWNYYYKRRHLKLRSYPGYRIFQRLKANPGSIRFIQIAEIGINAQGQLFIRPDQMSFEQIHSADPLIHWDAVNQWLYIPKPGPWPQLGWFRYIIKQCKRKYHCHLELTGRTIWTNIPDELKQQMLLDN